MDEGNIIVAAIIITTIIVAFVVTCYVCGIKLERVNGGKTRR